MKKIRYLTQRVFQWIIHILFIIYIISVAQHGIAESILDTSVMTASGSRTFLSKTCLQQTSESIEKAPQQAPNIPANTNKHFMFIGGVLIIVGTVLISSVFLPFSGYRYGFPWLFGNYAQTASTIFRYLPHNDPCALSDPTHIVTPLTHNTLFRSDDEASAERSGSYLLPLCKNNTSSSYHAIIETFFQQCGLTLTAISDTELRLNAQNTIYAHYGEVPVYILHNTTLTDQDIQQIYTKTNLQDYQLHRKLAFIILIDSFLENSAYQEMYRHKTTSHVLLIPINYLLIAKAVRHAVCVQELENIITIAAGSSNRYELYTPVVNPLQFFGRTDIMACLSDAISRQQHISVCGLRKIGKTSLIWQCKMRLMRHIVAYIDLQQIPRNCAYLAHRILTECLADIKFKYPGLVLPKLHHLNSGGIEEYIPTFTADLVSLWQCLSEQSSEIKLVLLLDEAEQLVPSGPNTDDGFPGFREFLGIIRGISQQYGFLVSVMVSTQPEIARTDQWHTRNNPGFQYYQEIFLSLLSEQDNDHMITSIGAQMGLNYTEEALSRIYYETGGHPYITRQLCSLIVEQLGISNIEFQHSTWEFETNGSHSATQNIVHVQDVENAVSAYVEYKRDYLESIWQRLSFTEQEMLFVVATHDSCALDDLITEEQGYQEKRERRKAISTLIETGILEKCEDKYSLTMGLLERFILTNT